MQLMTKISTNDALLIMLRGQPLSGTIVDDEEYELYEGCKDSILKTPYHLYISEDEAFDHSRLIHEWYMPESYKNINVVEFIINKCSTQKELDRVAQEMVLYEERGLYPLLRLLIFLVDHMRDNGVLWGVGRGSSVSSYVLYLIGVHRVDAIKYDLDIKEFLR
jgi:DNA polymerase III alpha subunit